MSKIVLILFMLNIHCFAALKLYNVKKEVITLDKLEENKAYLFYYPFQSTPAILIKRYNHTYYYDELYAYSAISPSSYSYPNYHVSMVDFYPKNEFLGEDEIRFCDEKISYSLRLGHYIPTDKNDTNHYDSLYRIDISMNENFEILIEENDNEDLSFFDTFFRVNRTSLEKSFGYMSRAKRKNRYLILRPIEESSTMLIKCNRLFLPEPVIDVNRSIEDIEEKKESFQYLFE